MLLKQKSQFYKHIGVRLRELRNSQSATCTEFARIAWVSDATISNYERNAFTPRLDVLYSIAKYFGKDLNYFTEGYGDNENTE